MRIDAYNKISQAYELNNKTGMKKSGKTSESDKVVISSMGKDIQVARRAVAESPDVRADKVAEIKARMAAGTYDVDPGVFADKLIAKLNYV